MLTKFEDFGVTLGWFKVWILLKEAEYVSHVIGQGKVWPSPKMVETIDKIPNVLRNVKEIQSFIGMMQYFAIYIPMMAQYRTKLSDLTKKDTVFKFTAEHEDAVKSLKHLLKQAIVYIVDWEREFFLLTDASGTAMGGCLMQKDDYGNYRPLRFMSRGFDRYERAQENRERELRAGWFCMLKCHSMLDHRVFTWFCDHSNARWAMSAKMEHQRIARLAMWLSQYYYTLQHIAGEHILLKIVDAVSRLPIPTSVEDREIFSPFETMEVKSILTASITSDIIRCPRHFEISTSTHAQLHRTGVDIVPSAPLLSYDFATRWGLDKMPFFASHLLPPPASSQTSTDLPMLTGMELYASFPTPTVAMHRAGISVCAMVESDASLEDTIYESAGDATQCLHYDSVPLLRKALMESKVELPYITVLHSTLDTNINAQLKFKSHGEVIERADQTLKMLAVLNFLQAPHYVTLVTMVVPSGLIDKAVRVVTPMARTLGYTTDNVAVRASNHGDCTSKQVAIINLRHIDPQSRIALPEMLSYSSPRPLVAVFNTSKVGTSVASVAKTTPVSVCSYTGDSCNAAAHRHGIRQDKHRALLAFPDRAQLCFSVLAPMPSVKHSIPLVITNPTNDPKFWSYRQCTVDEVCGAYCLTDRMREAATLMTEPEFVSKMSTTTPLLTMIEYYTEASQALVSLWQRQSKAGGRDKAVDVAHTVIYGALRANEHDGEQLDVIMQPMRPVFANISSPRQYKINGTLPVQGQLWVALMFVGYGSHVQAFKDTMPDVLIVTLDIDPKFKPTIECDYLQFEWQPFIDKHGAPVAIVFTPPCAPRSRQHKVGTHYDHEHRPVSREAMQADDCVHKIVHDVKVVKKTNPDVQWLLENPHYAKFTGLSSIQPLIEQGKSAIIQFGDYDVAFTLKRTICVHELYYWKPRRLLLKRNHQGVKLNESAGWNQQRRWAWPHQLSLDIATAVRDWVTLKNTVAEVVTAPMLTKSKLKAKSASRSAAKIAIMAASEAYQLSDKATVTPMDADSHAASDSSQSPGPMVTRPVDDLRISGKGQDDGFLSECAIREAQSTDQDLVKWKTIALIKARMEQLQQADLNVTANRLELRKLEGKHHALLMKIKKDVRGMVDHMFVDESNILVIASADKSDPIPVVSRQLGMSVIVHAHDDLTAICHMAGDKKMHAWIIERCWWYGMWTDLKDHASHCVTCQRMKFAASPGYGFMQLRWYNSPGKMVCIDLVVLTQSHTTSQGTRYLFTILDCFSHYPDAYPLVNAEASDCANCLLKWISSNGVMQELRSDGGSNLNVSEIFKELNEQLGVNKAIISNPYNPRSNPVERFHRWLGAALRILLFKFDLDVDESLPHILFIWRATVCRVTGFTPFMLHCGRPMRFANDLYQTELADVSHSEYMNHLNTLTTKLYLAARTAQRIAQHESAHFFNKKHGIKRDIRTGDLVLKKHLPRQPTDIPTHLLPRCSGQYRVLRISSKGAQLRHATTGKVIKS